MRCVVTSGTEPPTYEFMEFTQELSVFDEVLPEASRSAADKQAWYCILCGDFEATTPVCPQCGDTNTVTQLGKNRTTNTDIIVEEGADIDIKERPIVEEAKEPSRKADRPPKDEQDEIKLARLFVHRWNHDTEPRFRSKTPDVRDVWFWHDQPANGHDAGWTGGHHAQALAMRTMADVFEEAKAPARLRSANRLTGALKIAIAQPNILTVYDRWDADAYTIGLPKAYKIDIRTGKLQHQHRDNLISQRTAVAPNADCPTPYLDRVLDHLCGGDSELRAFYMTILGLSLIGDNGHGRAFFWVGGGGSGKSTLLSAAKNSIGDYGTALNRQTLEGSYNQHMTFVAALIGARMAVVAELEGEDLNVGRFKGTSKNSPFSGIVDLESG